MFLTKPFALLAAVLAASVLPVTPSPLAKRDTSVAFDGRTFVNHGLVGFVSGLCEGYP